MRAETTIAASPDDVWRAWADPEAIAQWFVDRAEGSCRPGEVMTWIFDGFDYRIPVPILEAEPGVRLVTGSDTSLMEVDIETADGSTTRLRLINSGFSDDDQGRGVESGWTMSLATLKHWLERYRNAPPRRRILALSPVTTTWAAIEALYADTTLARWIPDLPITHDVLAHTGRELLVAWPEQQAVVGMKAFGTGSSITVGLDLSAWRSEPVDDLRPVLDAALVRLVAATT